MGHTQSSGMIKRIIILTGVLVLCSSIAFATQTKENDDYKISHQIGSGITTTYDKWPSSVNRQ